jgi:hypothetical protein
LPLSRARLRNCTWRNVRNWTQVVTAPVSAVQPFAWQGHWCQQRGWVGRAPTHAQPCCVGRCRTTSGASRSAKSWWRLPLALWQYCKCCGRTCGGMGAYSAAPPTVLLNECT